MNNLDTINLMRTRDKEDYLIKYHESFDSSNTLDGFLLPLMVTIDYISYSNMDDPEDSFMFENGITIRDPNDTILYHGTVVDENDAQGNKAQKLYAQRVINYFLDPKSGLTAHDAASLIDMFFKDVVSTSIESNDYDCECCGLITNSTLTLKHNKLDCEPITYEYDGHYGYTYTPSTLDILSFAITGSATTRLPDDC